MKVALLEALKRVQIISGAKSSGSLAEILGQDSDPKEKYRNRIKSEAATSKKPLVRLDVNDEKIERELNFLQDILEILADKCVPFEKHHQVNVVLDTVTKALKTESEIVENFDRNGKLFRYMMSKWRKDKEDFQEKLLKCDEKIYEMENEIRETEVENVLKSELVIKWEAARQEQCEGRYEEEKAELEKRIQKANSDYEKELRIYHEVEVFTTNEIGRLQRLHMEWEKRYASECHDLDEDIRCVKVRIEKTQDRTQMLREVFIRRNLEIQAYLQQKQQLEEARRIEKLKWESAVKIQAWWRGTMYRNCLGPYKKKKKAPKKGKGKK